MSAALFLILLFAFRLFTFDFPARARVASSLRAFPRTFIPGRARRTLEINDDAKEIVQKLGEAINAAVERSHEVAEAIESLREAGYEMELTLRLEIGLREYGGDGDDADESARLELTDEDRRTLRSM